MARVREKETQPYRRVKILETIANAQANVSSYYETSTIALEVSAKFNAHDNGKKNEHGPMSFEDWTKNNIQPRISDDSNYSEEENGQYYWNLHKKYTEYLKDWDTQDFSPDPDEASVLNKIQQKQSYRYLRLILL